MEANGRIKCVLLE